jgi:hypothetical protein
MAVFERLGKKYVWLNIPQFVAELPEALANDEEFVLKVQKAYLNQVVFNHGWGFTVRHKGWRIRFDLENTTKNKIPRIYEPCIEEEPKAVQITLDGNAVSILVGKPRKFRPVRGIYEKGYGRKWEENEI